MSDTLKEKREAFHRKFQRGINPPDKADSVTFTNCYFTGLSGQGVLRVNDNSNQSQRY